MSSKKAVRILWHDDELNRNDAEELVGVWRSWFERTGAQMGATVTFTSTLPQLALELAKAASSTPFDILVLDVMLQYEQEKNFAQLGYAKEKLLRLDAGAQIAGLIRNTVFDNRRQPLLKAHHASSIVLLSATSIVGELLQSYVDDDRSEGVASLMKNITVRDGEAVVDEKFRRLFTILISNASDRTSSGP